MKKLTRSLLGILLSVCAFIVHAGPGAAANPLPVPPQFIPPQNAVAPQGVAPVQAEAMPAQKQAPVQEVQPPPQVQTPPQPPAGNPGYAMPNQNQGYPNYYGGYAPHGYGNYGRGSSGPWGGMGDIFSGDNPLRNPMENDGYWAHPNFQPWNSGPFNSNRWGSHPMNNMPWGRFPGWGDGFFGGFGPDHWKGITPWGNDVPFRWIKPDDPKEAIAQMWDDAINTPHNMGRMPPGWTAPYISVPNPVDVQEEFERNARNFPDEMRKMFDSE